MKPRTSLPPRTKPIARRRAKPRRFRTPRCDMRGCKRPQDVQWAVPVLIPQTAVMSSDAWTADFHGLCRLHATAEADRRFSYFIRERDGACRIPTDKPCVGPLQCCHLLSRRFHATRWDEENAVAGCAGHHAYWTRNPDRWAAWLETFMDAVNAPPGPSNLERLRMRAFNGEPMDVADVLARYPAVPRREKEAA